MCTNVCLVLSMEPSTWKILINQLYLESLFQGARKIYLQIRILSVQSNILI